MWLKEEPGGLWLSPHLLKVFSKDLLIDSFSSEFAHRSGADRAQLGSNHLGYLRQWQSDGYRVGSSQGLLHSLPGTWAGSCNSWAPWAPVLRLLPLLLLLLLILPPLLLPLFSVQVPGFSWHLKGSKDS